METGVADSGGVGGVIVSVRNGRFAVQPTRLRTGPDTLWRVPILQLLGRILKNRKGGTRGDVPTYQPRAQYHALASRPRTALVAECHLRGLV